MYINVENLFKLPNPLTLPLLLVLKQAAKKDVTKEIANLVISDEDIGILEKNGYIKYIKGKKTDSLIEKMRLDKKGTQFLNELDEPDVEEQDKIFANWLIGVYKNKGKTIKSGKKLLKLIAWFRQKTNIEKNKLAHLIKSFLDKQEETDFMYSHDVNNIFWKPTNLFQTKPSLDDSRLYSFYISNKEKFDKIFEKL